MSRSSDSRFDYALTGYFSLVVVLGVGRFASTPENLKYQLLFLLLAAGLLATISWPALEDRPLSLPALTGLGLAGLVLLLNAGLQPTTEARGYVLAAIGWLSFFVSLRVAKKRGPLRALFLVLILIGAGEAVLGLTQVLGNAASGAPVGVPPRIATGTFVNRNHFAGLLNMSLGLSLGALYTGYAARRRRKHRGSETFAWTWLMVLSFALLALAVFLSLSRAGSLILILNLLFVFVLLFLRRRQRRRRSSLPPFVAVALLGATLAVGFSYGATALLERFDTLEQSNRPQVYRDTLDLIADHPLAGVGPGMYRYRFRAYQTVGLERQYSQTHNDFLQVAAEWGLPLAFLFWGMVFWVLVRAVRLFLSRASPWRQGIGLGSAAAVSSLVLHSALDFNLQIPGNLVYFSAVLALPLAAAPRRRRRPGDDESRPLPMPAWLPRVLLRGAVPAALAVTAWCVFPRLVAAELADGRPGVAALERAGEWDPENPDYPYLLGRFHRDVSGLRDLELARHYLDRATELAPWGWRAHWESAQLYEILGDRTGAEAALLRAVSLSPRDAGMQWQLANLYLRAGERDKMMPPLAAALAADPSLRDPAWTILSKLPADLEQIDSVWPRDRGSRLQLSRNLIRDRQLISDPALPAFLRSTWNELAASEAALTPAEASAYLDYLLETGSGDQARKRWIEVAAGAGLHDPAYESSRNLVWNGAFELPLSGSSFDWKRARGDAWEVRTASDEGAFESTALRIDFDGTENLDFQGIRQRVLTRPGAKHRLSYRSRSLGLTTDQGVFLEVWDAAAGRRLLETKSVLGTTPWSLTSEPFETSPDSRFVEIRVRRNRSRKIDNRLAGTVWIDDVVVTAQTPEASAATR